MVTDESPKGLHALEYARHILDAVLGWPAKGNLELMADCLTAVQASRKLTTAWHAHRYMLRAIELAKTQGIEVHRMWFMNGEYTNVRPERKYTKNYEPIDAERTRQEQESPEWEASSQKARELLKELAGMKEWPVTTGDQRNRIKLQADQLRNSRSGSSETNPGATLPAGK